MKNYFDMRVLAIGENEAFCRNVVASFSVGLNPSIEEINDLKTAVSEAVTNCVVHAYEDGGIIDIHCEIDSDTSTLTVSIKDYGRGIDDVSLAREPLYTTKGDEERSGMGFTIMENFMNELIVTSTVGEGTTIVMTKVFNA